MVSHTRAQDRPGALLPLNQPQPVRVREDAEGRPLAVQLGRRWARVAAVADTWRIDDEWWRESRLGGISRRYYQAILEDGACLGLFQDLVAGGWYRQNV